MTLGGQVQPRGPPAPLQDGLFRLGNAPLALLGFAAGIRLGRSGRVQLAAKRQRRLGGGRPLLGELAGQHLRLGQLGLQPRPARDDLVDPLLVDGHLLLAATVLLLDALERLAVLRTASRRLGNLLFDQGYLTGDQRLLVGQAPDSLVDVG